LVTEILEQLNDPNSEFWSKAMIQNKLQRVVTKLYNDNNRLNSERNIKASDFYYEAGREYICAVNQIVISSSNKWIDIDLGGGEVSAAVAEGVYDAFNTLKDAITVALQTIDASLQCTYSSSTNKFTINHIGSTNFTIKWSTGSHASASIGTTIGYDISADDNGGHSTFTADNEKEHTSVGRIKLTMLEDRTDRQPGPLWYPSESLEQQHEYNWVMTSSEYYVDNPKYIIKYIESSVDGEPWTDLIIIASPIPTSRRTLRLYYQGFPPSLSSDTMRSTLMPEEEEVAVIRTCILAKFQEIDKAPPEWVVLLKDAELNMRHAIRPIKRGPKRITYIPD